MSKSTPLIIFMTAGLFITTHWAEPLASEYFGNAIPVDNYYEASKEPYYNPFGYDTCRRGKFRFDWMNETSSFFCPGSRAALATDGYQHKQMGKPRIVWGFNAEPGEFPSYVRLSLLTSNKTFGLCGGSLLNEYLVLTAAHCAEKKAGGFAYSGSVHRADGQRRAIKRACWPRAFNRTDYTTKPHDWAVLELYGEFRLTREVQPACVNFDYKLRKALTCVVVGFGLTEKNISSPLLKAAVVKQFDWPWNKAGLIVTSEVGAQTESGNVCRGDSGGPLYCFENCSGQPKMYVVGLVSAGYGNSCLETNMSLFVNTLSHRMVIPPLIKEMMAKREKRPVHRHAEEIDHTPITSDGIRCVDFHEPEEG